MEKWGGWVKKTAKEMFKEFGSYQCDIMCPYCKKTVHESDNYCSCCGYKINIQMNKGANKDV